jgi:hypothetical protein
MTIQEITHKKFAHVLKVVSSDSFLKMDALGGEIPFWIAPYDIEAHDQVEVEIRNLQTKLSNMGIQSELIDLFELSCSIIEANIGLEKMFEVEKRKDKERFKRALQSTVNIHDRLIPAIVERLNTAGSKILFIKGVSSVYPFIRSHTVLNNLQSAVKNVPTVMFFSGKYSGNALNLFGLMKDDNYYRAFNIDNQKI